MATKQKEQALMVQNMNTLMVVSGKLFASGMFKTASNEGKTFAIVAWANEYGISPVTALQHISIVNDKMIVETKLKQTMAIKLGCSFDVLELDDKHCKIKGIRKGHPDIIAEYTMADAEKAGLSRKDNYVKNPKDMMFNRAMSRCVNRIAPDALMGAITKEEAEEMGELVSVDATDHRANAREGERLLREEKGITEEQLYEARMFYLKRMDSGEPVDDIDLADETTVIAYLDGYLRPTYKTSKTASLAQRAAQKAGKSKETAQPVTNEPKTTKVTAPVEKTPEPARRTLKEVGELRDEVLTKMTDDEKTKYADDQLIEYTEIGLAEVWDELTAIGAQG